MQPIDSPEPLPTEEAPTSFTKAFRDWAIVVVIALSAAFLVRVFILQQFYISGPSMQTTLFQDNRVLVNKLSYKMHSVHRGDVVVFDRMTTSGGTVTHDDLIKRVIGLAGDKVEIHDCVVSVNGSKISEPYLNKNDLARQDPILRCGTPEMASITVPDGDVFVMGDNRPESFDSRRFGPIAKSHIIGRAFAVVWPLSKIKTL
jgi:signal peptidase I